MTSFSPVVQDTDVRLDVGRIVWPVRLRLALNASIRWALRGLAIICAFATVLLVLSRRQIWPDSAIPSGPGTWAILAAGATIIAVAGMAWREWPDQLQAIRHADKSLGLKDRLTTAHEYQGDKSPLARLQRAELRSHLADVEISHAAPVTLPLFESLVSIATIVIMVAAVLVPASHSTTDAQRSNDRAVVRHAGAQTQRLLSRQRNPSVARDDKSTKLPQAADGATRALHDLLRSLSTATTPRAALKALAAAQLQLQRLQSSGIQSQASLLATARALTGGQTHKLAAAMQSADQSGVQRELRSLASKLSNLSPTQRSALAQSLEQAANAAPAALSQTLRQAAFSLTNGDTRATQGALAAAERQIAAAQASAAAAPSTAGELKQLKQIQSDVANGVIGAPPARRLGSTTATPSKPSNTGKSNSDRTVLGPAEATRSSNSNKTQSGVTAAKSGQSKSATGHTGSGSGSGGKTSVGALHSSGGQGSGPVRGNGGGRGGGAKSGNATGGHASAGGSVPGHGQTVYISGKRLAGPGVTESGPNGSAVSVSSPAFAQVVSHSAMTANADLGRVALPPSVQDAVRLYFKALQHN